MKINDREITERLEEICRQLGINPRVDMDLKTPEAVESLFHRSGFLIHEERPAMVYIRNHIHITEEEYQKGPDERRKLHFTVCEALKRMHNEGHAHKYRLTNRDDNRYVVDRPGGRELDGEKLYPCQLCLANVGYRDFNSSMSPMAIVRAFDAKKAYRLMRQHFDIFRQERVELEWDPKSDTVPGGYSEMWVKISRRFRASRNYTCEQCGVYLRRHSYLVDAHHDDSDPQNNSEDNLRCLCKLCHQHKHRHYRVSKDHRRQIEKAREEQGISR